MLYFITFSNPNVILDYSLVFNTYIHTHLTHLLICSSLTDWMSRNNYYYGQVRLIYCYFYVWFYTFRIKTSFHFLRVVRTLAIVQTSYLRLWWWTMLVSDSGSLIYIISNNPIEWIVEIFAHPALCQPALSIKRIY